eukprot:5916391-Pleurochrysis_carterae.AAC.2
MGCCSSKRGTTEAENGVVGTALNARVDTLQGMFMSAGVNWKKSRIRALLMTLDDEGTGSTKESEFNAALSVVSAAISNVVAHNHTRALYIPTERNTKDESSSVLPVADAASFKVEANGQPEPPPLAPLMQPLPTASFALPPAEMDRRTAVPTRQAL